MMEPDATIQDTVEDPEIIESAELYQVCQQLFEATGSLPQRFILTIIA